MPADPPAAKFAVLAKQFEKQVDDARLTLTTEVALIYHCVDEQGATHEVRFSITPRTSYHGSDAAANAFVHSQRRHTIVANINSAIRRAPSEFALIWQAPRIPLRIVGMDLEITDA